MPVSDRHPFGVNLREHVQNIMAQKDEVSAARKAKLESEAARQAKLAQQTQDYLPRAKEWIASMSAVQVNRRWTMSEIRHHFTPRFRGEAAHPWLIGEVLQALGWRMRRDRTKAGRGKRYWSPPTLNELDQRTVPADDPRRDAYRRPSKQLKPARQRVE